jgi:hypothetical protein
VPGTAPGGVFIFLIGLRLPKKKLKFFGFSRGSHLRFLSNPRLTSLGQLEKSPGFFGDLAPQEKPHKSRTKVTQRTKSRPTDKTYNQHIDRSADP